MSYCVRHLGWKRCLIRMKMGWWVCLLLVPLCEDTLTSNLCPTPDISRLSNDIHPFLILLFASPAPALRCFKLYLSLVISLLGLDSFDICCAVVFTNLQCERWHLRFGHQILCQFNVIWIECIQYLNQPGLLWHFMSWETWSKQATIVWLNAQNKTTLSVSQSFSHDQR